MTSKIGSFARSTYNDSARILGSFLKRDPHLGPGEHARGGAIAEAVNAGISVIPFAGLAMSAVMYGADRIARVDFAPPPNLTYNRAWFMASYQGTATALAAIIWGGPVAWAVGATLAVPSVLKAGYNLWNAAD